jgi:hypothetical protein
LDGWRNVHWGGRGVVIRITGEVPVGCNEGDEGGE